MNATHRLTVSPRADSRSGSIGRGFTIVELLVVIGIISLIIAITLPAMRSVRITGQQNAEMSTARQLMTAYHAYANANRDHVLAGFTDGDFDVYGENGRLLTGSVPGIALRTYTWRIAPYLSFDMRGLYVNQHRDLLEQLSYESHTDYMYKVGLSPSLGLNTQWVGGDAGAQPPAFLTPSLQDGSPNQVFQLWHNTFDMGRYYVTRVNQVRHPHRLLVFASARSVDNTGLAGPNVVVEGNFRVTSPYSTELNPEKRWSDHFNPNDHPEKSGFLSPRYFNRSVTAFFDGHVDMRSRRQLEDMRYWSNWATHEDWKLPRKN